MLVIVLQRISNFCLLQNITNQQCTHNVLDFNKDNSNIILKFSEESILYEVSIMLTNAKNSSSEIINDGKWIFSKLINARAEASRWFNDCISGINYNKDVKTPDYTYFCYPAADILNFAFTTQY